MGPKGTVMESTFPFFWVECFFRGWEMGGEPDPVDAESRGRRRNFPKSKACRPTV